MTGIPSSTAACDGGHHGGGVLAEHDQRVDALGDQDLDVGELLGGRGLRVGRDVGGAGGVERGDDGGLVGLPALLLEVGPARRRR